MVLGLQFLVLYGSVISPNFYFTDLTSDSERCEQWRINHDANDAMAWGPPLKGAPRAAV